MTESWIRKVNRMDTLDEQMPSNHSRATILSSLCVTQVSFMDLDNSLSVLFTDLGLQFFSNLTERQMMVLKYYREQYNIHCQHTL